VTGRVIDNSLIVAVCYVMNFPLLQWREVSSYMRNCISFLPHNARVYVCPSICLSIRPSRASILSKRLNAEWHKQCHAMAQRL